ncbi:MAG: hypothetical protein BWY99_00381 [Synergistetes bacterium ADurb.BinA166]|nr:MAG: hypothetical protein BWY99_00381 [Synergistetes bacterium ADurb.BinA166]
MKTVSVGIRVSATGSGRDPIQRINAGTIEVACKTPDLCGVLWVSGDWTWWRVENLREISQQEWEEAVVAHVMKS